MAAKKFFDIKVFALLFALFFSVSAFAAAPIIQDDADLLSEEEEQQLSRIMEPILEYGGVAFVTNKDVYVEGASAFAKKKCTQLFNEKSGVVLLIDMHNRRIEFYSTGYIYKIMGEMWSDIIADNIYKHATNKEYFVCAQKGFTQIYTILNGGKVAAPMRYVSAVLLAIAITLLLMYCILYNSRKKAKFGKKMQLLTDAKEKELHIELLDKKLVRTERIVHASSGSGGGRSGGGGGGRSGGSRGGGGGHGF